MSVKSPARLVDCARLETGSACIVKGRVSSSMLYLNLYYAAGCQLRSGLCHG